MQPTQHCRQIGNGAHSGDKLIGSPRQALGSPLKQLRAKRIGREQGRFRIGCGRCLCCHFRGGSAECADQFRPARIMLQNLKQRFQFW